MTSELSIRIMPDNWLYPIPMDRHFSAVRPLEVDVGCGKGRFLLARAASHPDVNFLGIDRMLRRIRKVNNKAIRSKLDNVRVLRMEAYYAVTYLLAPETVTAYYILFPDPWPKKKHHDHRLFNPAFIDALHRTLIGGGVMHFATDHLPYFDEVRTRLTSDRRFRETDPLIPTPEEQTDFERYYAGRTRIGRCSFMKRDQTVIRQE